jgi:hypothetical protein
MIVRNAYTGALHEVPEQQLYEVGEPVFDGFGNPVGGIFDDIVKGVGSLVSAPVQAASSLISPIAGMARNLINPIAGVAGNLMGNLIPGVGPQAAAAPAPGYTSMPAPMPGMNMPFRFPFMRPPFPTGWQHAPLPYTGLGPKRLYMRCAVWPGPQGLVPGHAANMPPGLQPGMPGAPGMPGGFGGRHRHGRHRRRR